MAKSFRDPQEEIKFYTAHGAAGIPKTQIKRITASTTVDHDKVSNTALPMRPADREVSTTDPRPEEHSQKGGDIRREAGKAQASTDQPRDGGARLKAGDTQAYQAKKVMLTSQLDAATNKYLAASGARNPEAKKAALDEMREHSKHILDLEDELKKKNGGVLPPWWND